MENFTIEHTNLGKFFLEKFHNRRVSFDLKYFKTHNKVPLSVNQGLKFPMATEDIACPFLCTRQRAS